MSIAQLTIDRSDVRGRQDARTNKYYGAPWTTSGTKVFYRGGAVAIRGQAIQDDGSTAAANASEGYAGTLSRIVDGTLPDARFGGIVARGITIPALPGTGFSDYDLNQYGVDVLRKGTAQFRVNSAGASAAWEGQGAWLHSDCQVENYPLAGTTKLWPLYAGRIVRAVSSSLVEVDISDAVLNHRHFKTIEIPVSQTLIQGINNSVVYLAGLVNQAAGSAGIFKFNKRVFVGRIKLLVQLALSANTIVVNAAKNQTPASFTAGTGNLSSSFSGTNISWTTSGTDPVGTTKVGYMGQVFDYTDSFVLAVSSSSNQSAVTGSGLIQVEYVELD